MSTKQGHVALELVESRLLRGNPWNDPCDRSLPVYLPPSYGRALRRRYPVLWCLSGFTGSGLKMLNVDMFRENLPQRLDRLVGLGRMDECIVAMPDCSTWLGGSQYVNSTANGRYEDHLCEELVPLVDRKFRTLPERDHRGVFGASSGGFGALMLAMRRPDLFGAAASHSGDLGFEFCYRPDFARAVVPLERRGGVRKFVRTFRSFGKLDAGDFAALNSLAMAAAYSPTASRRQPRFDLPFDLETGELNPEVWERWLAWDPVLLAESHVDVLRKLHLLYVDAGSRDEYGMHLGARLLSSRLRALKVPHVHEEFDGTHSDTAPRYDHSLPKLSRALGH
jgi:enterochelin esterase family protein